MNTGQSTINTAKKEKYFLSIVFIFILLGVSMINVGAQNKNSSGSRLSCLSNPDPWNKLSYSCSEKELVIPSKDTNIEIIAGGQGAIAVRGWNRNEFKIRILSEAWSDSTDAANKALESISHKFEENKLTGAAPKGDDYRNPWAVSFEIMVPDNYSVKLNTVNGAIYVDDLKGNIIANAVNGAIYLNQVTGKVAARSVNGRVEANISAAVWDGESLDVGTENGDVAVFFSKDFSAQLNTQTERGKIFIQDQIFSLNVYKKTLNEGGKTVTAQSENGNILVYFQK